jgi:hypothetical protein
MRFNRQRDSRTRPYGDELVHLHFVINSIKYDIPVLMQLRVPV